MTSFTLASIEACLGDGYTISGEASNIVFDNLLPISEGNEASLCWLSPVSKSKRELLSKTKAKIILCTEDDILHEFPDKLFIKVANPRLTFARIVKHLFVPNPEYTIHPTAVIHPEATIAQQVSIGPHCVIGKCTIGAHTILHGNVFLFDHVTIGQHVTIMPNTTIGSVGFGYERNEEGNFELFPHIGGVIIADHVDIGSSVCIDRGTLGNTIIGEGTKIDNLVHIAHNVQIGKHCAIIAHAMIGGSTVIQDHSWIAPSACIRDGLTIGKNATVGLGAVVVKPIPENEIWMGNPAAKYERK